MQKRYVMLIISLFMGLLPLWLMWPSQHPVQAAQVDDRLVIKEATLALTVSETSTAVQTALNLAESYNSYVLNQRQWETGDTTTYGELTFGVPAEQFEGLLNALRTLGTVEDEQLSGQDVLATAVDLQSRLDNLTSNQSRMRTFLDQTRNTTETLAVHQRLVQVENQLNDLQGQLNFYTDRANTALITLRLTALLRTQQNAQSVADFTIYRTITWGPWLLFLGFCLWILSRIRHRSTSAIPQREENSQDDDTKKSA